MDLGKVVRIYAEIAASIPNAQKPLDAILIALPDESVHARCAFERVKCPFVEWVLVILRAQPGEDFAFHAGELPDGRFSAGDVVGVDHPPNPNGNHYEDTDDDGKKHATQ